MKIMEDVYFASQIWLVRNPGRAVRKGITHVIAPVRIVTQSIRDKFDVLEIPETVGDLLFQPESR